MRLEFYPGGRGVRLRGGSGEGAFRLGEMFERAPRRAGSRARGEITARRRERRRRAGRRRRRASGFVLVVEPIVEPLVEVHVRAGETRGGEFFFVRREHLRVSVRGEHGGDAFEERVPPRRAGHARNPERRPGILARGGRAGAHRGRGTVGPRKSNGRGGGERRGRVRARPRRGARGVVARNVVARNVVATTAAAAPDSDTLRDVVQV